MTINLPPDILNAIISLISAVLGWITRGHVEKKRNGNNKTNGDK